MGGRPGRYPRDWRNSAMKRSSATRAACGPGVGQEFTRSRSDHDAGFGVSLPEGIEPVDVIRVRVGDDEEVGLYPKLLHLADDLVGHGGDPRVDEG